VGIWAHAITALLVFSFGFVSASFPLVCDLKMEMDMELRRECVC